MRVATITEAKNGLSRLIDLVRAGEAVLIVDRGIPVARLESAIQPDGDADARRLRLERSGQLRRSTKQMPHTIFDDPPPVLQPPSVGPSVVDAVLAERRSGW